MRYGFHGLSAADTDLHGRLREFPGVEREAHLTALARPQVNALKSAQASYRSLCSGPAGDIELNHLIPVQ